MPSKNEKSIDKNSQRTDQLIEMYKIQIERWNKRRDIEWRFVLTFWSGVVIITGFLAGKIELPLWSWIIYLIVWLCYVRFWLYGLWSANDRDKREANNYKSEIDAKLCIKNDCNHDKRFEAEQKQCQRFLNDWNVRAQLLFIIIILIASGCVLYGIPKSEPILEAFITEL